MSDGVVRCPSCTALVAHGRATCARCGTLLSALPVRPQDMPPNLLLRGRYLVGHSVSDGKFSINYTCYDEREEHRVILKEFFPRDFVSRTEDGVAPLGAREKALFDNAVERFFGDYSQLRRMRRQPALPRIYDVFRENGTVYAVIEYIGGETLAQYIKSLGAPLFEDDAIAMLSPVFESLDAANSMCVFHENLDPSNILRTRAGTLYLIDFSGGAVSLLASSPLASSPLANGDMKKFIAPELLQKVQHTGAWADAYGAAALLYSLLTGAPPVPSRSRRAWPPVDELPVTISETTANSLYNALTFDQKERTSTVCEFMAELNGREYTRGASAPVGARELTDARSDAVLRARMERDALPACPPFIRALMWFAAIVAAGAVIFFAIRLFGKGGGADAATPAAAQPSFIPMEEMLNSPSPKQN